MISYENLKVANLYTEGFVTTIEDSMTLSVESGTCNYVQEDEVIITHFPEFAFDVEADDELMVVYDVYLLEEVDVNGSNIHIDRTELGGNNIAFYEGEAKMFHCLMSFSVPPNTGDLNGLDIKVRTIQLTKEGEGNE